MGFESAVISRSVHARWKDYRASEMRDNPTCSASSKLESLSPHHSGTPEQAAVNPRQPRVWQLRAMLVQLQTNGGVVERTGYIAAGAAFAGITS